MYFVYFCLTWMPAYLNEARHLSLSSSSLYTTFSFAGMATVPGVRGARFTLERAKSGDPVAIRFAGGSLARRQSSGGFTGWRPVGEE